MNEPGLTPQCPWSGFRPPNVDWCEAELCAWITNPANTWSNLAYVVLGLWMWHAARNRAGAGAAPGLGLFGPASVFVGLASGIYHASATYMLQILDFVAMFVFSFLIITQNARRLGWTAPGREPLVFAGGVLGFTALVPLLFELGFPIQALVALLIGVAVAQEAMLARRPGAPARYGSYIAALGLLALAGLCSLLDVTRVWCDPDDHWLQGHAAWHVLSAASLAALFHFYAGIANRQRAAPA